MPIRRRLQRQIGVYKPGTSSDSAPDYFITETEARRLVRNEQASRINHGKAIRIRRFGAGFGPDERMLSQGGISAVANCIEGIPVHLFSLEMTRQQVLHLLKRTVS